MSAIVAVTAVRPETRAVLAALSGVRRDRSAPLPTWKGAAGAGQVTIVQSGIGRGAARRAAAAFGACDVVVSLGFAGALTPGLAPGDLVLPDTIVWDEGGRTHRYVVPPGLLDAAEAALERRVARPIGRGAVLSSPVVVESAAAKHAAGRQYDAVAVEMEAAALAEHALASGVPLIVLRVILDPAELSLETLPPGLDVSWGARLRLVTTPAAWPLVATLRRHLGRAAPALTTAVHAVLPALPAGLPSPPPGRIFRGGLTER